MARSTHSILAERSVRALLAVGLLVAGSGRASPADEARRHFDQGEAFYGVGEYRAALAEYLAAYQIEPLPELLFNVAQAARFVGERKQALDYYRRYLDADPKGRASDEARVHIAALEQQLAVEAAASRPPAVTTPARPVHAVAASEPRRAPRWLPPLTLALGLVAAGAGGALVYTSEVKWRDLQSCAPNCMPSAWAGYEVREPVGVALLAVGGALAVAGALWWILAPRPRPSSASPSLAGSPRAAAFQLFLRGRVSP
jgi:tetratricopeptide (TPR) repeat protein